MLIAPALVCVGAFATLSATAQVTAPVAVPAPVSRAADCAGAGNASGEVASVADGKSLRLTDGREVRLAALETPPIATADEGSAGMAAKAALESLVLGRQVILRTAAPASDRYGRVIAYAFIATPSGEALVQRDMLAGGHALLSPFGVAPVCRAVLRAAERAARARKLGLWGDPYYVVKQADNPADVLGEQGRFAVVGGKVASVRESGGIVYVNFGQRWSEDFTVTILKRNERLFTGAGMAPAKLAGRQVEVRGWVEERNGPAIEVVRPEQIEFIDKELTTKK
jgi:endonuclease YncB( thermonuclease family)